MNGAHGSHAGLGGFDRRLYLSAAIAFAAIVVIGFGRTYYFRSLFDLPPLPSGLVHVHGLLMTTWVLLFIAQAAFISSRKVRVHRRVGYAGIGLGALIIATGIPTALRAAKFGSASTPPGIAPMAFLAVPLIDLVMFAGFFGAAIYYRRTPAAHKGFMLLAAINFLPPALGRVPVPALVATGPLWALGLPAALALLCLGLDTWRRGRVNRVFLAGTLVLLVSYPVRLAVVASAAWMRVATWLVTFV